MLTVPSLALWWINKDEDWYIALPAWQKYGFWNFKVGDQIMRLPKPFDWGFIFAAAPEAIADARYRKDSKPLREALGVAADLFIPDVLPAAVRPAIEVSTNFDYFRGREVVPYFMEKYNFAEDQYYPWTSQTVKELGSALGVSPLQVEHILTGYSGGFAKDVLYASDEVMRLAGWLKEDPERRDWNPADIPVAGRLFSRDPDPQIIERVHKSNLDALNTKYKNRIEHMEEQGKSEEEIDAVIEEAAAVFMVLEERHETWKLAYDRSHTEPKIAKH